MIFQTEEFGRIEVKPRSVEYPNGYVYFFRDDYETTLIGLASEFHDIWGRRFSVSIPTFASKTAILEVWQPRTIARVEI